MRIQRVELSGFRRFTHTTVEDLPQTARLVVLAGPNGAGKSSLFDAFAVWAGQNLGTGTGYDATYHTKQSSLPNAPAGKVLVEFDEPVPLDQEARQKLFYLRSAYRNDPDFTMSAITRAGPIHSGPRVGRMIENDMRVADNYQRMVSRTLQGVYDRAHDYLGVGQLRDLLIGDVRGAMQRVFDDLVLSGTGDPLGQGSFYFEKGESRDFHYKNLSGGEKAAFDLLLDLIVKREFYNDTVYCIDEPELHMGTRLQGQLLCEMVALLPVRSQMWIASHSVGMMRAATEMYREHPEEIVFLDFAGRDFDAREVMTPRMPDRGFWRSVLEVALDDIAELVAPRCIVLCEGRPRASATGSNYEFDARCYSSIFASDYQDTDFISVGSSSELENDHLGMARSIQTLLAGTRVIRVLDRDDRSDGEVMDLVRDGFRVLSRRNLECYLLDDAVLIALCEGRGQGDSVMQLLEEKRLALKASVEEGYPHDDLKRVRGVIYNAAKRILRITQVGNSADFFLRDTLAPLVRSTSVYPMLRRDVFGE